MKYKLYILYGCLLSLILNSCESKDPYSKNKDLDQLVKISLNSINQDKEDHTGDPDYEINSVRILAFQQGTRRLKFNSGKLNVVSGTAPVTFTILTGTYDFVFIANEHSVESNQLTQHLDQWTSDNKTMLMLDDETFHYNAFGKNKNIPATAIYKDVNITTDSGNTLWQVIVTRLAIRLDLDLLIDGTIANNLSEVRFANLPDAVPFFEKNILNKSTVYYENGYQDTYPLSSIPISDFTKTGPDEEGRYKYTMNRLILPASIFANAGDISKAISIHLLSKNGGDTYTGAFGHAMPTDYTSPRNTYYKIEGILQNNLLFLDIVPSPWTEINIGGNAGPQKLNVEHLSASVSKKHITRLHFWSNQPSVTINETGYYNNQGNVEFDIDDFFIGLAGNNLSNLYYDSVSGSGYIDIQLSDQFEISSLHSNILCIYLNACGLSREIKLIIE